MEPLPSGKHRLHVRMLNPHTHVWKTTFESSLSRELVESFLEVHGPRGLGHALTRIEESGDLRRTLLFSILPFVPREEFSHKRLLDFGCGSGTSTFHLARMFPDAEIVGLDLLSEQLIAARALMRHMEVSNATFIPAASGDSLPQDLSTFDFVTLNAVYEHLLPAERKRLLPSLWALLSPGGVLFVNMTPYRYYPLEGHTTMLPLLNYLPDSLALRAARWFAGETRRGIAPDTDWADLLRWGVRGATEGEILRLLAAAGDGQPVALKPRLWGYSDVVDLWYAESMLRRPLRVKALMRVVFKAITRVTGAPFAPDVTMAVRKVS